MKTNTKLTQFRSGLLALTLGLSFASSSYAGPGSAILELVGQAGKKFAKAATDAGLTAATHSSAIESAAQNLPVLLRAAGIDTSSADAIEKSLAKLANGNADEKALAQALKNTDESFNGLVELSNRAAIVAKSAQNAEFMKPFDTIVAELNMVATKQEFDSLAGLDDLATKAGAISDFQAQKAEILGQLPESSPLKAYDESIPLRAHVESISLDKDLARIVGAINAMDEKGHLTAVQKEALKNIRDNPASTKGMLELFTVMRSLDTDQQTVLAGFIREAKANEEHVMTTMGKAAGGNPAAKAAHDNLVKEKCYL